MKKINKFTRLATALAVSCSMLPAAGITASAAAVYGDVDGSGNVTAIDASLVLRHVVGTETLNGSAFQAADVDGDGTVSAIDASMILRKAVGALESFPAENPSDRSEVYKSRYQLSNPNADVNARKLYDYINDNYGKAMITCQQESTWMGSPDYEMDYIFKTTGKYPAMRGLDFMNGDFDGVVQRSKEWHEKGGIVTICWHTGVNGFGYQESLGDTPDFTRLLTKGTDEYNAMIENWDRGAKALQELRDAGIPVLWRPFHEFDGQWFWWGKGGADNFIKLWQMMYDRYTNEFELNNLIWVLGYSGEVKDGWYPGNDYCDIIGSDTYDNSTHAAGWKKLDAMNTGKPLAFHECGNMRRIENFEADGAMWSWFMIWHTNYITDNNPKMLEYVYNHEKAITLDELPDFYA